jgi:hypothetical protein
MVNSQAQEKSVTGSGGHAMHFVLIRESTALANWLNSTKPTDLQGKSGRFFW